MEYRHVQHNHLAIAAAFALMAVYASALAAVDERPPDLLVIIGVLFLIALVVLDFSRMTVRVADGVLTVTFAIGWPRRRIQLSDVTAYRPVRNRWWYGWGVRKLPRGWMFNVFGLDAVELELTSGRVFRIGTNDVEGLLVAIGQHTPLQPSPV